MPRPLLIALIAFVASANLYADTDREIYDQANEIFKQAEETVAENLEAFVQANETPIKKAREEMAELIARVNKEGRTQLATSLQKQLNGLEETVKKRVRSDVAIARPPEKPLLEKMAGKWSSPIGGTYHTIERNGVTQEVFKTGKVHQGGQLKVMPDGTAEVVYSNGCRRTFSEVVGDKLVAEAYNPDGSLLGTEVLLRTK